MGQYLSNVNSQIVEWTNKNETVLSPESIVSGNGKESINLFLSIKTLADTTINSTQYDTNNQILNSEKLLIKQIQNYLLLLTKSNEVIEINTKINKILIENGCMPVIDHYQKALQEMKAIFDKQQQLQKSLRKKLDDDNNNDRSIFAESCIESSTKEKNIPPAATTTSIDSAQKSTVAQQRIEIEAQQFSYFAIQLLTSLLLVSIKANERVDPSITSQIIILAIFPNTKLTEVHETRFTGEFISSIILAHIDIYNSINLHKQFKNGTIHSSISFEFHPNTFKQLFNILEQLTLIITRNSNSVLIHILTVCVRLFKTHLQFICATKSNVARELLTKIDDEIIKTSQDSSTESMDNNIDLTTFLSDDELRKWFDVLLKLACDDDKSESTTMCTEASKALVYIMDLKVTSFTEKLSFIHKYIIENKYQTLVEQFFIELNQTVTLFNWIEILCNDNDNKPEKAEALKVLYSFVDICLNPTSDLNEAQKQRIKQILVLFQQFFLVRLVPKSRMKRIQNEATDNNEIETSIDTTSALVFAQYISHILRNYVNKVEKTNDLINQIFVGLCLMTQTEIFNFPTVQPIFTSVLPLLADYLLQNTSNQEDTIHCLYWLIGKISYVMITGSQQNSLEIKHVDKLKSFLFAGGCEKKTIEHNKYLLNLYESDLAVYSKFQLSNSNQQSSSDHDFLMSIYNNINQGAQLISKMKIYVKNRHHLLKSIEQQANDICAALFAVYIKHYRRINLAKLELSQTDNKRPHSKLLLLYEYASHIQILFVTTKAQGGDCDELYKQIKMKTLFLLLTVKESNLIPIIQDDLLQLTKPMTDIQQERTGFVLRRRRSRWTTARHIFTILRHTLHACIRFKKCMLARKQAIEQNQDNESILNKEINNFVCNNLHKKITLITNEEIKSESDELTQCIVQQHERGIIRLITYRFIYRFIQKALKIGEEKQQALMILTVCLPYLRKSNINWSYLENIEATNNELKEEIRNNYYSIIKIILSFVLQSKISERNMFNLLNLSYKSADIRLLYHHQFIETLFKIYVNFVGETDRTISFHTKLIGYNWFRLYILKLCKNIQIEELKRNVNEELIQQQQFIFNILILNELKGLRRLKQTLLIDAKDDDIIDSIECRNHSLNNSSIGWFIYVITKNKTSDFSNSLSSKFEIELCTNQLLTLLLRCIHFYEHCRSVCGTVDFIEELLHIYQNSQNRVTILLALKILRDLLPSLPETTNGTSSSMMNKLLNNFLFSIGDSYTSQAIASETVTELIYIYRTIMSYKSPWQMMATQLIFDSIISSSNNIDLKSLETMDTKQWTYLLASLYILGGYIQPYGLGSIVKIYTNEENNEYELGIIIDIDMNARDQATPDTLSYFIQYLQENKTEWVTIDKLEVKVDVSPPNLLTLPNMNDSNLAIHSLFDTLGYIIQIDISSNDSLRLLQLKRYSITTLYRILSSNQIIDIFMQKPYASSIAQLSIRDLFGEVNFQPIDLRLFNRSHLEQYSFSLDRCERLKQIVLSNHNNINDRITTDIQASSSFDIYNKVDIKSDQSIVNTSSTNTMIYNGWKPYASNIEIELYKKGRIGSSEISIVPFPREVAGLDVIGECGNKHQFKGRIYMNHSNYHKGFPSFIVENLELNEGSWYYCVKLPVAGLVQIGWATTGFTPKADEGMGIGDDKYSWSFDGSRGTLYSDQEFQFLPSNIRWKANDVCGCGIEINGENTRIKYWLNGKFLGTAFAHQSNIASTTIKCNLLPNGPNTTYFPGVTVQAHYSKVGCCEFIFSPEDMIECPLPEGYKPILMPKFSHNKDSFVAYPYSAYLVGDDVQDFVYIPRSTSSTTFLRDFVNEHHIETTLTTINDYQLILTEDNDGFPFSIDNQMTSLTISFDFQILTKNQNDSNNTFDILLFTLEIIEKHSIKIPFNKNNEKTRTVILIHPNEHEIKIYINKNICQTINNKFDNQTMTKFNFHFLPHIAVGIKNFAIWKYALSEEHIQRIFTSGISYVAIDYKQQNEYRLQANTFTFTKNQQQFQNEFLIPFNESFDETIWKQKQKQIDMDESKYFKTINETDQSIIQLYGNKSYLVVKKSIYQWYNYTIILDISIPNFPMTEEQLTIVILNLQAKIFITSDGKLCLSTIEEYAESELILNLNEFIRLLISVDNKLIKIYANGLLALDTEVDNDSLVMNSNQIHLFREIDVNENTTNDDTLRIECKSITFLNRSIMNADLDETLKSPNYPLETLVAPPFSIIAISLINIGYEVEWIKSVMKQYKTINVQMIDTIIREHKEEFLKTDFQKRQKCILIIFSRLGSSIDKEKLENLINTLEIDTDDQIVTIGELVLTLWNELQTTKSLIVERDFTNNISSDQKEKKTWFHRTMDEFNLNYNFTEWILDKSTTTKETDTTHQLFDLNKSEQEQIIITTTTGIFDQQKKVKKSIQYSHKDISQKQYLDSRIACEHGLISIYACDIILNILKIWSNNSSHIFPLEKFGDYSFIVKLLRSIDYHYTSIRLNDSVDRMSFLIKSILKNEIKELLVENIGANSEILPNNVPLLYHLQKDIIIESIRYLLKISSSIDESDGKTTIIDERTKSEQSNLNFIFKILNLLVELITDKSTMKQNEIDVLIPFLFPEPLINVILMQASKNFSLNERVEHFMSQLLIELLSNEASMNSRTIKILRIIVMDFVFLDLARQKSQLCTTNNVNQLFEIKLYEFPQNFQDLCMVIDIINAMTDETKQTQYPELLVIQSYDILDETLPFTLDDIVISNYYFDKTSDLQLISLMNNDALIEHSFSEFIHSLAIDNMLNLGRFELYPSLLNIPVNCVQNRAKLFHLFEIFVEKVLSLLDFNLPPKTSILTDKIRIVKNYLSHRKRIQWFEQSLIETKINQFSSFPTIQFDFVKANNTKNNEQHSTFYQGYEQLHENAHLLFRNDDNPRLWQAQYIGMHSVDHGGPYRDSITSMCSDICSTQLPLFILCPNGRINIGLNRDRWIPNVFPPNQSIPIKIKKQYQFIGQLMGMAIRKKHYLDLKFPNLLWKQLLGEQITMKDIEAIDIQSFAIIKEMENNIQQNQSRDIGSDTNYLFSSIMSELRFDIVSSAGHTYELIPGGKDIPITADNFNEYCTYYREYRLNEFHRQIEYIRQGLCSVVPNNLMTLLTTSELEEAVCGKHQIDIALLKRNTQYNNSNLETPYIQQFWKVLIEMFNDEQRKLFLKFVWGRNTLPNRDEDFGEKFSINLLMRNEYEADAMLPRSHTCSFALHLPSYSTIEIMYERLNYAITHCSSIDADG
ncbi:unnamed protein product [Rotaria sordida]|uniref:Uncharacterized protein n=2 Tax=Rotaria sordida TaxID=392033 RepID=A0A818JHH4_9BILA|nr:unnamed protein product [Rotaria sordida]